MSYFFLLVFYILGAENETPECECGGTLVILHEEFISRGASKSPFLMKHWVPIDCFDALSHFWLFTLPVLLFHHIISNTETSHFQGDYKTLQQAAAHHHKNDRVHIGNCLSGSSWAPAPQPSPLPLHPPSPLCAQLPSVHTTLQTMRDTHRTSRRWNQPHQNRRESL